MSHNTTLRELRDSSNEHSSSGGNEAEKCVHNEKNGDIEKENEENESLKTSQPNAQVKVVIVFPRKKLAGSSASEGTSAKVPELSTTHTESANHIVVQEHCYCKEIPPAEGSLQGILQSYCKTEKPKNDSDNQEQVPDQVPRPKILKSKNDYCEVPVCRQRYPHKQLFSISSIMVIRTEVYLRLRWTYDYYSPKTYYSRVCFCEDHFDAADFVDPNVRPLQLKVNVLPHLLRLRLWRCGKWDWAEYIPGCPYALDKPPANTPKMEIESLRKKIQHVSRAKLPETTPGMLPCENEAKICSRNQSCRCGAPPGSETPEPDDTEEVLYYDDDDDDDIEELNNNPKESHSDAESWKDSDLEEEEFQKVTEQAIQSGRNVRTRRDCKISDWQFLPSRLFMPKSEKPPKLKKKRKRDVEAESAVKKLPCLEKNDKCYYCDEWFPNTLLRSRHMKNVHPEYNLWICGLCRNKLGSKKSFYQHMWNHMKAAHQCTFCDKQFVTKKNYETHCAKHLSDAAESDKIQCPVCSESVDNEDVLATHMLGHSLQETGNTGDEHVMHLEAFKMSTDFMSTQVVYETSQNESPLFTIKVLEDLNQPVSVEPVQQVFQCPDCMKVLESQQHLTVHMMNHGLTYKCDTCCETIEGWSNIHQHMLSHVGPDFSHIVTTEL